MTLYPTAGEASVTVVPYWFAFKGRERPPSVPDVQAHILSNGRRAAKQVRLFIKANNLTYMWTMTYRVAASDRGQVRGDVERFYARAQALWGHMPLLSVIERGRRNTRRLHVHVAAPRWLCVKCMRRVWGHGFVWVGDPGKLPGHVGNERLARYLAKYVTKEVTAEADAHSAANILDSPPERVPGRHRYSVTRGWAPEVKKRRFWDIPAALAWLAAHYAPGGDLREWSEGACDGMYGVVVVYPRAAINSWLDPPGDMWATFGASGTGGPS